MGNKFYSINVLLITYKQEKLIGRALESILCQRVYGLNKIVICDDCSPDDNWEAIQKYAVQFPEIIEAHRNKKNLGIYGNVERVVSLKGDADLYYIMSGDDALCDGWFKAIQEFINERHIDITSQSACIFSDWKLVTPTGTEKVFNQSIINKKNVSPISVRIRGLVSGRSMLQTKKLLDQQVPVDLDHGVSKAEKYFDFQPVFHSEYFYYCPYIGSAYYSGIGISTTSHKPEYRQGIIVANRDFLKDFRLVEKDKRHIKFKIAFEEFHISPSIGRYFTMIWYYITSIDTSIGFSIKEFIRLLVTWK